MADGYKATFNGENEDLINYLNDLPMSELKALYRNKNGNTRSNKPALDLISKVYKHRGRSKNPETSFYTPWGDTSKKAPASASPFANIPSPAAKKAAVVSPVSSNASRSVYDASYFIDNGFYPEDTPVPTNKEIANMNASSFIDNAVPGTRYFDENRTNDTTPDASKFNFGEGIGVFPKVPNDTIYKGGQSMVPGRSNNPVTDMINQSIDNPIPDYSAGSKAPVAPMGPPRPAQSAFTGGGPSVAYMEAPTQQNYATVDPFNIFGNRNGAALDAGYFAGRKAPDKPGLDYSAF